MTFKNDDAGWAAALTQLRRNRKLRLRLEPLMSSYTSVTTNDGRLIGIIGDVEDANEVYERIGTLLRMNSAFRKLCR